MPIESQEGIYYRRKPTIGNAYCMVSLKFGGKIESVTVGRTMTRLWNVLTKLKQGITTELNVGPKKRIGGNLSILIGYGPNVFTFKEARKSKPMDLDRWDLKPPRPNGGGVCVEGSGLSYSESVSQNHLLSDDIILQFIADDEFFTKRAVIEVWKQIRKGQSDTPTLKIDITGIYSGFQRADHRNWMGFHDGVSNMKSQERPHAIFIKSSSLSPQEKWLHDGTYLTFLKIGLNLGDWENISVPEQEIIVGRDKLTGCPLVGVDSKHKPIKDHRCPVPGTSEVIDPGNEYFRDHPPYGNQHNFKGISNNILQESHIGTTRAVDQIPVWDKKSFRIFRQGFEFLEYSTQPPGFIAGLNFVSFQNTPERLFKSLTYLRSRLSINDKSGIRKPHLDDFTFVLAGGIFLVPPFRPYELFPGQIIFSSVDKRSSPPHFRS